MGLSAAHWVFLAVTIAMIFAMAVRRGVIILAMAGIVTLALLSPHAGTTMIDKAVFAAQSMFRAAIVGGSHLFDTILLVGFLGALLHLLREEGIDKVMAAPFARAMRGRTSAFLSLTAASLFFSLFFWPTPAALMIGACLLPAALRAGLPPVAAGMAISMAGHGMALSGDPVIQAAARITGAPGGLAPSMILPVGTILGAVLGIVALGVALARSGRTQPSAPAPIAAPDAAPPTRRQIMLAIIVPVLLLGTALLSAFRPAETANDGTAVALLGGMAVVLLILTCCVQHGTHALDHIVDMMTEGFFLVIRIFAPVVPVLGFFMIGDMASAPQILGDGAPGLIPGIAAHWALNGLGWSVALPAMVVAVGAVAGRDGVAFTGLPLAGAVAVMLSGGDAQRAAILASLGQVITIWVGAGVLLPWSGVRTVAAEAGLTREALAQANRLPVIIGIAAATIVATVLLCRACS